VADAGLAKARTAETEADTELARARTAETMAGISIDAEREAVENAKKIQEMMTKGMGR
jgi:hypothetical protein